MIKRTRNPVRFVKNTNRTAKIHKSEKKETKKGGEIRSFDFSTPKGRGRET